MRVSGAIDGISGDDFHLSPKPHTQEMHMAAPILDTTPGPWKACRRNEDFNGPYFDLEEGDTPYPFHSIEAATGTVMTAHDLFILKEGDALLLAAAPELLSALERLAHSYRLLLARKPVRDVEETLAEVDHAIAKATTKVDPMDQAIVDNGGRFTV